MCWVVAVYKEASNSKDPLKNGLRDEEYVSEGGFVKRAETEERRVCVQSDNRKCEYRLEARKWK